MMQENILSNLSAACPWKDTLRLYDTLESTNTLAKELAKSGAPQGTVVIADRQTGGRGRMGRQFHSPAGQGIYLSVILRPGCRAEQLMHLTCAVAVAMCNAVEKAAGLRPQVKWINDLILGGRKVGGILTELSLDGAMVDFAVVGIGINCNQQAEDFPAALQEIAGSLTMAVGKSIDREALVAAMIDALYTLSTSLLSAKYAYMARYRADCITLGREVAVHSAAGTYSAVAKDIDDDGSLCVHLPDDTVRTVSSGEVSVRGLYGYI